MFHQDMIFEKGLKAVKEPQKLDQTVGLVEKSISMYKKSNCSDKELLQQVLNKMIGKPIDYDDFATIHAYKQEPR